MSRQTSQLLEAFDALPNEEQRAFTTEFLRRAIPFDSDPLDDQETARAADEIFRILDEEENGASSRSFVFAAFSRVRFVIPIWKSFRAGKISERSAAAPEL